MGLSCKGSWIQCYLPIITPEYQEPEILHWIKKNIISYHRSLISTKETRLESETKSQSLSIFSLEIRIHGVLVLWIHIVSRRHHVHSHPLPLDRYGAGDTTPQSRGFEWLTLQGVTLWHIETVGRHPFPQIATHNKPRSKPYAPKCSLKGTKKRILKTSKKNGSFNHQSFPQKKLRSNGFKNGVPFCLWSANSNNSPTTHHTSASRSLSACCFSTSLV